MVTSSKRGPHCNKTVELNTDDALAVRHVRYTAGSILVKAQRH